jgi:hypothetical protein
MTLIERAMLNELVDVLSKIAPEKTVLLRLYRDQWRQERRDECPVFDPTNLESSVA